MAANLSVCVLARDGYQDAEGVSARSSQGRWSGLLILVIHTRVRRHTASFVVHLGRQKLLSIASGAPVAVRDASCQMQFLAIKTANVAFPRLAVVAGDCGSSRVEVVRICCRELAVSVRVCWPRHLRM